jgi:hypothetical protein
MAILSDWKAALSIVGRNCGEHLAKVLAMQVNPITESCLEADPCRVEQRLCRRRAQEAMVLFSVFNSDPSLQIGQLRNYCEHGLCLETRRFIKPGTPLYIRLVVRPVNHPAVNTVQGCRTVSLAKVKWCHAVGDKIASQFSIGVKFY